MMCTLTVYRGQELLVTMNRDELRSRAPELGPRDWGGWVGPKDSERGGTWFGLNRQGAVACLLNDYPDSDDPEPPVPPPRDGPSRGELIPLLLAEGTAASMRERLQTLELHPYPPFLLLLLDRERGWMARWGSELGLEPIQADKSMWASSGWRSRAVQRWRAESFAEWRQDEILGVPSFHLLGGQDWSPLASRPLSATRSLTQVRLDSQIALVRYWPAPDWPPHEPAAQLTVPLEGGR